MAISYVGGVEGGRAGATTTTTQSLSGTLTGGSNTSPSAGDLVVVLCAAGADTTAAPSQDISGNNSGAYTGLTAQSSVVATTYDSYHRVSYFVQGSTVDTSLTIPSSGSARNAQRWIVHVFRGVDSTTPMDVTATYATGTGTGRPNPALIAPSTAGAWILAFYASAAGTGAAYTAPTDFATDWLGGTTADTADVMTGGGYYTGWTSGNYDPAAITAGGTTNAADSWTATTIALRPAPPLLTQAAYRVYADGTETGSTALEAQDTNHTADVSGGDYNFQLRTRLQETAGNPGDSTDDYQLQYELNDSGTYYDIGQNPITGYETPTVLTGQNAANNAASNSVTATYPSTPTEGNLLIASVGNNNGTATLTGWTQAFLVATSATTTLQVFYKIAGASESTSVNATRTGATLMRITIAEISGIETSSPLDQIATNTAGTTSTPSTGTTATTTQSDEFLFAAAYSSAGTGTLTSWNNSFTAIQSYVSRMYSSSRNVTSTGTYTTTATVSGSEEFSAGIATFKAKIIYGTAPVANFNSASLTDGNATTNRLGSGSGSFVAGEISEDGLVDNLQITASNYTELLYSLTIESTAVADADTLDFRVLRNGATTGMTYTVTPRITISAAVGNYSGTPGIATLTLTAQTPTVTATNNQAITFASPTALSITAQTPTSKLDNRVTPDIATLTLTAQTPTVTATNNYAITTASPTALTLSPQAPTLTATNNIAITLASPTALTLTAQTPTATVSADQTVTLGIATLTTTAHIIGVAVSDNQALTPGTGSLTLTPQTPTVAFTENKSITLASPSSLTLSPQTPSVVATDNKAITLASPSSLTLTAQTPTVAFTANTAVTPETASLTTTNWSPTVAFTANQAITTASPSSLTLSPQSPTVSATDNKAITFASPTSLTLTAQTPTVSATDNTAITLASPTALVTTAHVPGVAVSSSSALTPGTLSLTLTPQTPTVDFTANTAVTPDTASLSLTTQTPIVDATDNKTATPGTASLSLTPFTPTVATDSGPVEITPGVASMLTAMFAPSISVSANQTITPGIGQLRLRTSYPIVNGQVRERSYYVDTDANIFWVINEALGLVEEV